MTGLKILIVEDDTLIAMELEERLGELGYIVLGPVGTLAAAEKLIAVSRPDAALLDANLDGVSSVPLGVKLVQGPAEPPFNPVLSEPFGRDSRPVPTPPAHQEAA